MYFLVYKEVKKCAKRKQVKKRENPKFFLGFPLLFTVKRIRHFSHVQIRNYTVEIEYFLPMLVKSINFEKMIKMPISLIFQSPSAHSKSLVFWTTVNATSNICSAVYSILAAMTIFLIFLVGLKSRIIGSTGWYVIALISASFYLTSSDGTFPYRSNR